MTKATKKSVNYRSKTSHNCGTCKSMRSDGCCAKVQGLVDRAHVCDLWAPKKAQ